jgi:hypothetical protein
MDAIDKLDSIDSARFYLEFDFVNKHGLPLTQLLSLAFNRLPSRGRINRFEDIVAIDAATTLIDELPDVDPKKPDLVRKLYDAQLRMI